MFSFLGSLLGANAMAGMFSSAAGVLSSLIQFLTATAGPAFVKFLELSTWALSTLWEGLKDIVDNVATVLTVCVFCVVAWAYGKVPAEVKVHQCEKQVQVQKVYIEKQCKPKVIYKQAKPKAPANDLKWPWED